MPQRGGGFMTTTWPADKVERRPIDTLIPYARNARTHSDAQVAQIAEWLALVSALPADWFPRETHGLLTDYCRHVVRSRRVALLIGVVESGDTISRPGCRHAIPGCYGLGKGGYPRGPFGASAQRMTGPPHLNRTSGHPYRVLSCPVLTLSKTCPANVLLCPVCPVHSW